MGGLWRNSEETREGKYLVKRRDGTVPNWPYFVLGGRDPAAPAALRAYADEAERLGLDPEYVGDVRSLAATFEEWLSACGPGDPDGPRHRKDNPRIVGQMRKARGA